MKKIIGLVVVFLVAFCSVSYSYGQQTYAPTVVNMMPTRGGWVPATGGVGTGIARNVPVTIRVGTVSKVLNSRLGGGVAGLLMSVASSMLYDAVKNEPELFPETKALLNRYGFDVGSVAQPGEYVYKFETYTPRTGSGADMCVEECRSKWEVEPLPTVIIPVKDFPAHDAVKDKVLMIGKGMGSKCYMNDNVKVCYGSSGCQVGWNKMNNMYTPPGALVECDFKGETVTIYYVSKNGVPFPDSDFIIDYVTTNKTGFDVIRKNLERDINDTATIPGDVKRALDEMLNKASDALNNNTTMLQRNADATTTLAEKLQTILKQGIPAQTLTDLQTSAENTPSGEDLTDEANQQKITEGTETGTESGEPAEPICGAPPLPPCEVTGNWNDVSSMPQDISQTGINENENTQVLGTAEAQATALDEQKTILGGIMQDLWDAINVLVGRIMTEINRFIGENPSGSCSLSSPGVFGGNFNLSVCDIDFSGWRDCLIAAFGIIGAFTLISKW